MEAIVIPISAIEHFVYCPRQCALVHCDGIWADNAHTVRGSRSHRRVDSGKARRERGKLVLRAIPLWPEELGLTGRADAVELDGDVVRPVEYKSGVPHGTAADLQVCAQAMCLEEMLAVEIPRGGCVVRRSPAPCPCTPYYRSTRPCAGRHRHHPCSTGIRKTPGSSQ